MARRQAERDGRDQAERYQQAAEDALGQLDWCIGYLHGIHKTSISAQLAKNRAYIRRQLMREAEQPVPSQTTRET
jgi:hypothetical protein